MKNFTQQSGRSWFPWKDSRHTEDSTEETWRHWQSGSMKLLNSITLSRESDRWNISAKCSMMRECLSSGLLEDMPFLWTARKYVLTYRFTNSRRKPCAMRFTSREEYVL